MENERSGSAREEAKDRLETYQTALGRKTKALNFILTAIGNQGLPRSDLCFGKLTRLYRRDWVCEAGGRVKVLGEPV